jgi:hypothetical protein
MAVPEYGSPIDRVVPQPPADKGAGGAGVTPLVHDGTDKPLIQQRMETHGVRVVPMLDEVRQRPRESRLWEEMEAEKPPPEVFTPEELEVDDGEEFRDPEWEWPEDAEPADLDQDVEPE